MAGKQGFGDGMIGALLRYHREAANLSQEQLAERSGVSAQAISALERGVRRHPRTSTIELLAAGLRLDASERQALVDLARGQAAQARVPAPRGLVPRELPRPCVEFTGRAEELACLRELLDPTPSEPFEGDLPSEVSGHPVVISVISGMGGIGKSALAIQAAHQLADAHRFPDGQLYLNLQGATPGLAPVKPIDALGHLLRSLGVHPEAIPASVEEAASRYRSVAADRRLLVLLDDAHSAEQVRPLLPGCTTCRVLVTSRQALATLEGARTLHLHLLSEEHALELLSRIAGRRHVASEPESAAELVRRCGRLPLSIRIAGARLLSRPTASLRELVADLEHASRPLEVLEADDLSVRASFQVSMNALEDSALPMDRVAAAAFGLLGVPDGPDISTAAAARLLELPEPSTRSLLNRLVDTRLLDAHQRGRYRFHDLVRLYARDQAARCCPESERLAALARVIGFYTATAWRTLALLRPGDRRLDIADSRWTSGGTEFADASAALDWLEAERTNLLSAITQAAEIVEAGRPQFPPELPGQLTRALFGFFVRGHQLDLLQASKTALRVAQRVNDRAGQAGALHDLGLAYESVCAYSQAIICHKEGLDLFRELGDRQGEADSLTNLGVVYQYLGRFEAAIDCQSASLAVFRELRDQRGEATSLANLGVAYMRVGRNVEALACLRESLTMFRALDACLGQAGVLQDLDVLHARSEYYVEAISCHRASLPSSAGRSARTVHCADGIERCVPAPAATCEERSPKPKSTDPSGQRSSNPLHRWISAKRERASLSSSN